MKLEARGKYPGVKVHLDEEECHALIEFGTQPDGVRDVTAAIQFTHKLGKKIHRVIEEEPAALAPRSEEEIRLALEREIEQARLKLERMATGQQWNGKEV